MARKEHFTLRLNPATIDRILRLSRQTGEPKTALAERFLEEGLRMSQHPGIDFRDGPAGRRPGLTGHYLDVWEVGETVQHAGGDPAAAADYLEIDPSWITAALDYYGDYPEEIDEWIECNAAMADEAEAASRRQANRVTA